MPTDGLAGSAAADLATAVAGHAPFEGINRAGWPGLLTYRLTSPVPAQWSEARSLSLFVVAQGRKRITVADRTYEYDPSTYLVLTRGQRFQAEILEASTEQPFLSLVLHLGAETVRRIAAGLPAPAASSRPDSDSARDVLASPLHTPVREAVIRFLRTIGAGSDQAMLGPLYAQELAYRLLCDEQGHRLLRAARAEQSHSMVSDVLTYLEQHLPEPVSIADLASHVCMSPSAFGRRFRELSGQAPYQYVKSFRLEQARRMLATPGARTESVAREVGYGSVSHFIVEFRRAYGTTPHHYAVGTRHGVDLDVEGATTQVATR